MSFKPKHSLPKASPFSPRSGIDLATETKASKVFNSPSMGHSHFGTVNTTQSQ